MSNPPGKKPRDKFRIHVDMPKIQLPSVDIEIPSGLGESPVTGRWMRRMAMLSIAMFVASVAISATNAVISLASVRQSPYIPTKVGFEGQLADGNGDPVTDGSYTVTFSLYDVATGGTALWSEAQSVTVSDGLYSVQLGAVTALDATDFEGDRWLGVQVSGDSEMTPRIPISAVPFALNARQAMGIQGYDVATSAPDDGEVLTWDDTNQVWGPDLPGARTFPELNPVGSNEAPQDFFANYRNGAILRYVDADTLEVSAGEIMVNGYMRRNTSAEEIDFAGTGGDPNLGLDTGSAQSNTRYYVYAVADDAENTFDLIISANSGAPTGSTNFRQLGWFETNSNSSPIQIRVGSASNATTQPGGLKVATGTYAGNSQDNRFIFVGFRPIMVELHFYYGGWVYRVFRWDSMPGDYSCAIDGNTSYQGYGHCGANIIQAFESTAFQVGSDNNANGSSYTYYWIAWGY